MEELVKKKPFKNSGFSSIWQFIYRSRLTAILLSLYLLMLALFLLHRISIYLSNAIPFDVVVYDATAGGVIAAVSASRKGLATALICASWPACFNEGGRRIGGMTTNGLGSTDKGSYNSDYISGLAREFYARNRKVYGQNPEAFESTDFNVNCRLPNKLCNVTWNLEPHVAEQILLTMLTEAGVTIYYGYQVVEVIWGRDRKIESIVVQSEREKIEFRATVFIDSSYEGDLMASAGLSYTVGREASNVYNESLAGKTAGQWGQFRVPIDPFDSKTGQPLPLTTLPDSEKVGSGDHLIQAYNYRLCVTKNESNMVPFPKPENYDPSDWELLRRWISFCVNQSSSDSKLESHKKCWIGFPSTNVGPIPGDKKYDMNNGGSISTDCHRCNHHEYPEASYEGRKRIWWQHVNYQQGLLYFMANDPSMPTQVLKRMAEFGLCKDEFHDNFLAPYWPPGLYVREARRLIGDHVFTENTPAQQRKSGGIGTSSIGIGGYPFDSHSTQRYACVNKSACNVTGPPGTGPNTTFAWEEGFIGVGGYPKVYQIPFSVLLPKKSECRNLLVLGTPSASHVGVCTLRMEPQYMIMGHAAGTAAFLAVEMEGGEVHDIDMHVLNDRLTQEGMITQLLKEN